MALTDIAYFIIRIFFRPIITMLILDWFHHARTSDFHARRAMKFGDSKRFKFAYINTPEKSFLNKKIK